MRPINRATGETVSPHFAHPGIHLVLFAVITLVVLFIGQSAIDKTPEGLDRVDPSNNDGRQNLTYAYNLARYGIFSRSEADQPDIQPDYYREPLYPALMAFSLKLFAPVDDITHACFVAESDCGRERLIAKRINIPLLLALAWGTTLAAYRIGRRWWAAYLSVGLLLSADFFYINTSFSELPAALFLLLHGWFLYEAATTSHRRRSLFAVLSGLALGFLILTKAIFLYWLIVLAVGMTLLILLRPGYRRLLASLALAVVVPAALLTSLWILRNVTTFDRYTLTSRSATVLAVRAEYSYMTPNEFAASFAEHSAVILRPWLRTFFSPSDLARFDRSNPDSFFYRVTSLTRQSEVVKLARERYGMNPDLESPTGAFTAAELTEADDAALRTAAVRTILDHFDKQLLFTLTFAYSGAFVQVRRYDWNYTAASWALLNTVRVVAIFFIPSLWLMTVSALRKRRYALLLFFAPALFSYALHAAVTHYIPRYSAPLVPILIIALILLLGQLGMWVWSVYARRRRSGTPMTNRPTPT